MAQPNRDFFGINYDLTSQNIFKEIYTTGLRIVMSFLRERSSNSKADAKAQKVGENKDVVKPPTPTTPEVVSVLSEEKRDEYKKLKLQLALKEQQQQKVLGVNRKVNTKKGAGMKKNAANLERKTIAKPKLQKEKQKTVVQLQQRLAGLETQTRLQQEQRKLQKPQQQREARAKEQQGQPKQQPQMGEEEQGTKTLQLTSRFSYFIIFILKSMLFPAI